MTLSIGVAAEKLSDKEGLDTLQKAQCDVLSAARSLDPFEVARAGAISLESPESRSLRREIEALDKQQPDIAHPLSPPEDSPSALKCPAAPSPSLILGGWSPSGWLGPPILLADILYHALFVGSVVKTGFVLATLLAGLYLTGWVLSRSGSFFDDGGPLVPLVILPVGCVLGSIVAGLALKWLVVGGAYALSGITAVGGLCLAAGGFLTLFYQAAVKRAEHHVDEGINAWIERRMGGSR